MTSFNPVFVYIALILYASASVCYFAGSKNRGVVRTAFVLSTAGFVFNLLALVNRAILTGRLPLANGCEFLLSFTWITVLMYLIYETRSKKKSAGGAVMLIATLLLLSVETLMSGQLDDVSPLLPALKSPWLTVHVLTAAAAYSGFTLAAGLALVQLRSTGLLPGEDMIYRIVAIAFAMLSLSIVLGAVWAEQAWGSYWSWDPKETWALITWIIYALYLHLHRQNGWKGKKASIMVIAGFVLVLFTFFGVNYLLSGLHSYALNPAMQTWSAQTS
ncbi:MAG: cytochrome c biogenesis protein CcsA [Syntrophomonadaceae bacterium]|nr:cytochrome c biogenesis protein CcsA [Syntrophomonadaceae bacterium]